jgi:hypothetical protein
MKGKNKGGRKNERRINISLPFIISGLVLIFAVSLLDGFAFSFVNALQHIYSDLTIDIKVHAYIAGLIILLYGIYRRYTNT